MMSPAPSKLYVVGGQQRARAAHRQEWHQYRLALICELDLASGVARPVAEWMPPPEARPDDPEAAVLFKAATRVGDRLCACTQTEVLIYALPEFKQVGYVSLASFNDLHHVRPTAAGTLLVVSTGLDLVQEIEVRGSAGKAEGGGRVLREWSVAETATWERFDRAIDYRKVVSTKPHAAHPNYVWQADGEIWVTRFEQKDALCLTAPGRRIDIGIERPHDGVVAGRHVYFTTVDGHVVIASLDSDRVERVVDLNAIACSELALGWCRGLLLLDDGRLVVGFSRLRPTKISANLRWLQHRVGMRDSPGNLPTRVSCFDIDQERLCWEHELEAAGLSTIFSVHPAVDAAVDAPIDEAVENRAER
jgi:hypothetical protein